MKAIQAEAPLSQGQAGHPLSTRLRGAALDAATGLACIAVWSGTWTLLNECNVPEMPTGYLATCALMLLSMSRASSVIDGLLQRSCYSSESEVYAALAHAWTLLLALLSLLVWRMGFFLLNRTLLQQNDAAHECTFLVLSGAWLSACGRLSSITAPPAAFAPETSKSSFMDANASGQQIHQIADDLLMTVPAIVFWDSLWLFSDRFALPHMLSGAAGLCTIFCICAGDLHGHVLDACRGAAPVLTRIVAIQWTCVLGFLSLWIWRGFWSCLPGIVSALKPFSRAAHLTAVFDNFVVVLAGLIVLLSAGRTRSLVFPPVSASFDDHELMTSVGMPLSKSCGSSVAGGYRRK